MKTKSTLSLVLAFAGLMTGYLYAQVAVEGEPTAKIGKGSLFETFASGGPVMWLILLCSLAMVAYAVERFMNLRSSVIFPEPFRRSYDEVFLKASKNKGDASIFKPLVTDGKSEAERLFSRFFQRKYDNVRDMEEILQEYIEVTQWRIQKNVKPLGLITQISPLLGLFGTVIGMIKAFDVVAEQGLGKPELLANGMAVALLTTCFGIGVAIPASWLHHHFLEKSSRLTLMLYTSVHELVLEWSSHRHDFTK